jgi:predicted transposase YbfD/YdcC
MDANDGAPVESVVFLDRFKALRDPRQLIKVVCRLDEMLLVSLRAVLAGAETFTGIAQFGKDKLALLRRLRPFANGAPDHDRPGAVFAALDAEQFQNCFVNGVAAMTGFPAGVIAIEPAPAKAGGKTVRGWHHNKNGKAAIHMVSAFAARQRLALGQVKVAEKSNEIVAVPGLPDLLAIEGAILTIDTRCTTVFHDIGWLEERHGWPGLQAVVMVESERESDAGIERETRFCITSSTDKADKLGDGVRRHWAVESMHWLMDMVFRDDECRVRSEQAPANFVTIKHIAHNLLRRHPARLSMTTKRPKAGWNEQFLLSLIS